MAFQVIPRERLFYDLLEQAADNVAVGALELDSLVEALPEAAAAAQRIRDLEHAGDDLTHQIMATLNTTFVTPFDRQDIHKLGLDARRRARCDRGRLGSAGPASRRSVPAGSASTGRRAGPDHTKAVGRGVRHLRTLSSVERDWSEINRLEREGDRIYRRATAELFSGDHPAIEVLKWKDIVDQVEDAIDRLPEHLEHMESIALKYA